MAKTKERRAWLYLNSSEDQLLQRIGEAHEGKLTEAAILSVLIGRALSACAELGYRLEEPARPDVLARSHTR